MVRGYQHRALIAVAVFSAVVGMAVRPVAGNMQPVVGGGLAVTVVGACYLTVAWILRLPEARRFITRVRGMLPGR